MRALFKREYIPELEVTLYEARKQLRRYWAGTLSSLPDFNKANANQHLSQTQYDIDCQNILLSCLSKSRIKMTIYSEESASPIKFGVHGDLYALIDPLDGTHNALMGFPNYTSSVAIYHGNEYVFGWIYDISRDLVYTAALGEGAYLQSAIIVKRLNTRKTESLEQMRLSFHRPRGSKEKHKIERLLWAADKVRVYSCSSLEICLIAAGVLDAFIDIGSPGHERSCDIAAAELILRESGGALFDDKGHSRHCLSPSVEALKDNGTLIALSSKNLIKILL
ncbi:inositol monophosphatase family protein [Pseudomonas sp. BW7P1]|uniref:inositol monophosphatase family protein n=1 Tax=Pseudomonas TaxID=286 RepID=UPI0021AD9686|nr:inositol monophosphatase family protein [Pseudomonas sp. BW7P1]UWI60647.1 inositol monophosphatase family protein [Pseudomonas sp. BW7P1]